MRSERCKVISSCVALLALSPALLQADNRVSDNNSFYVAASFGAVRQSDSDNRGAFTGDFTTGSVTGVPSPLTIPAGSPVGWETDYDRGNSYSLTLGLRRGDWRFELEYAQSSVDIDSHKGVSAAGIGLDDIDAGVLLTGNVGDLGVTAGALVSNGQGEQESSAFLVNVFYDFDNETAFTPFVGLGVGISEVDVEFQPSGVGIIDDDDSVFVYQFMLGGSYAFRDNMELVLNLRYRDGDDAEVSSSLLPAALEVENKSFVYDLGLRYTF